MPIFYGVSLDQDNPYLKRNLDRLEKRFRERYSSSLEKKEKRELEGRIAHASVLKSISDNKNRLLMVKVLKRFFTEKHRR